MDEFLYELRRDLNLTRDNSGLFIDANATNGFTRQDSSRRCYKPEIDVYQYPDDFVNLFRGLVLNAGAVEHAEGQRDRKYCNLVRDYADGEFPPIAPRDLLPEHFERRHAIAYMFLNVLQKSSPSGFQDAAELADELAGTWRFPSPSKVLRVAAEVCSWTQTLTPRQIKPSIFSLLCVGRELLTVEDAVDLMAQLRAFAERHQDCAGEVAAFVRYMECFLMPMGSEATEIAGEVFLGGNADCEDPEHWTILHDLATVMVYLNSLRGLDFDDNDKFNFQIYMQNWEFGWGEGRVGLKTGSPIGSFELLEEVDAMLFSPSGPAVAYMPRVAKSCQNLRHYYFDGVIPEQDWKAILFQLYRTTLAQTYMTHEQKVAFKQVLSCFQDYMDLSNMALVIDYQQEMGRSALGPIDTPERNSENSGSLAAFCAS